MREVIVGLLFLLGLRPVLLEDLAGILLEAIPISILLEPQFVVGNEVALRAVTEPIWTWRRTAA